MNVLILDKYLSYLPALLEKKKKKKINNMFPHSQTLAKCVPRQGSFPFVLEEESSWEQTDIATCKCLGKYFQRKSRQDRGFGTRQNAATKSRLWHHVIYLQRLKKVHSLQGQAALNSSASSSERKTSAGSARKTSGRTLCCGTQSA